jgi:hypothetical protein
MLKAIRFEILRDIKADGLTSMPLAQEPVRVATLLNEQAFLDGHYLVHGRNVFLEDRLHDWQWTAGLFRYFTRVAERADVLVVYEEAEVSPVARFDPQTGQPLQ